MTARPHNAPPAATNAKGVLVHGRGGGSVRLEAIHASVGYLKRPLGRRFSTDMGRGGSSTILSRVPTIVAAAEYLHDRAKVGDWGQGGDFNLLFNGSNRDS